MTVSRETTNVREANVVDLVEIAELMAIADAAERWVLSPADGYKPVRRRALERLVRHRFLERRAHERVAERAARVKRAA